MIDAAHDGFDIARLIDRDAEFVFNDDSDYQNKKKRLSYSPVVPELLRTLVFARPCGGDQFAAGTVSPSLDMSR